MSKIIIAKQESNFVSVCLFLSCFVFVSVICQVPKNHAPIGLHHHRIRIAMDSVETAVHEGYLYCYRVLYKKLDDPDTSWNAGCHRRNPPAHPWIGGLTPYTNYTFRVMAISFQSAGLISESFNARTLQYSK